MTLYGSMALGLNYHSPEVIHFTRNKMEMRNILRTKGTDPTPSKIVASQEELINWGSKMGYPLVLKPLNGRGSLGICIINSPIEVSSAWARFLEEARGHSMLVEPRLEGSEWSVESFSEKGVHYVICVTQKFKDPVACVEIGHCLPAPLPEDLVQEITDFVAKCLTDLGFLNGPAHTEVFLTPSGPRIVETHARLAGDSIVELIRLCTGVDLDELWVRQSAGESIIQDLPQKWNHSAAIAYGSPEKKGRLMRIEGVEACQQSEGVVSVEILQQPGTQWNGVKDSFGRGLGVIAMHSDASSAYVKALEALGKIVFYMET
jgi:biotin carboxylase